MSNVNGCNYTAGTVPAVYLDLLNTASHILIAGATGSGKSVCLNGLIYTALHTGAQFVMIDVKRVELCQYRPVSMIYADTVESAEIALETVLIIIDDRYTRMQRKRLKSLHDAPLYVCIDELADLFLSSKTARKNLIRICQIGRAANVHVIACTQCVLAKILDTALIVNFDFRIGLRTATAAHSRLIIGTAGLESLPFPKSAGRAEMMLYQPGGLELWQMPYIDDGTIRAAVKACKPRGIISRLFKGKM